MPLFIFSLALALAATLVPWSPAAAQQWELNLEALVWNLERDDEVPITVDTNTTTVATDSEDLDPGFEPGSRATLGWMRSSNEQFQISGFWVNSHSKSQTVTDPDSTGATPNETLQAVTFRSYGGGQGFAGDWQHTATLESDIWGVEGNYVRSLNSFAGFNPSILLGLRFVRFTEDMNLYVLDQNPARGVGQFISTMDTDTTNNMYGAQIGVAAERPLAPWVALVMNVKGGLFANDAGQDSFFNDGEVGRTVSASQSETGIASMVQARMGVNFTVMPNVTLGFGYEVTHLSGLALAPNNFSNNLQSAQFGDPLTFDTDGSVTYHGGNAHVTLRF